MRSFPGQRYPAVRDRLIGAGALAALMIAGAGCAGPAAGRAGALHVTVRYFGGPELPGGGTPSFPVPDAEVKVAANGTGLSAATNKAGVATFSRPAGRYAVSVRNCGYTRQLEATVTASRTTALLWACPIA